MPTITLVKYLGELLDNYPGEILGGIVIQLVLRVESAQRSLPYRPVNMHCDKWATFLMATKPLLPTCTVWVPFPPSWVRRITKLVPIPVVRADNRFWRLQPSWAVAPPNDIEYVVEKKDLLEKKYALPHLLTTMYISFSF